MHREHVRRDADQADVRHVGDWVVADLLVEHRPDAVRADVAQHERVAVGLGLGGGLRGDRAAGAGLVLDDDLLVPDRAQAGDRDACRLVDAAAGNEADQEFRRLGRIGLREAICGERSGGEKS